MNMILYNYVNARARTHTHTLIFCMICCLQNSSYSLYGGKKCTKCSNKEDYAPPLLQRRAGKCVCGGGGEEKVDLKS